MPRISPILAFAIAGIWLALALTGVTAWYWAIGGWFVTLIAYGAIMGKILTNK